MDGRDTEGRRRLAKLTHLKRNKDRDEDLNLFKELNKREHERRGSLLQPVSEEFDKQGNYPLYRIPSARKGSGNELLGENEKNDYDWLKTPPATPLFPSLEMENPSPQFVIQKEIPIIIQPPSRFAGADWEAPKSEASSEGSNSSNLRPKPNLRPSSTSSTVKAGNNRWASAFVDQDLQVTHDSNTNGKTFNWAGSKRETSVFMKKEHAMFDSECNDAKPTNLVGQGITKKAASTFEEKERVSAYDSDSKKKPTSLVGTRKATTEFLVLEKSNRDSNHHAKTTNLVSIRVKPAPQNCTNDMGLLTSNIAKTLEVNHASTTRRKHKSRNVSPQVTSTLPTDFSNQKPENMIIERRSVSTLRGRHGNRTSITATGSTRLDPLTRHQRNSCSPSVARGRKQPETTEGSTSIQKGRANLSAAMGGKRTHVIGSKIVEKVMNARKGSNQMRSERSKA